METPMTAVRCLAALTLALVLTPAAPALPAETRKLLDKADSVELLSLDPMVPEEKKQGFHGYKVLGVLKLEKKADREKLLKALYKGIDDSDGSVAGCFIPRHGIRAKVGGKVIELVICFQCHSMNVSVDGKRSSVLTAPGPAPTFNKLLKDAKIPLPKQPK
jgi:hypothetical protein